MRAHLPSTELLATMLLIACLQSLSALDAAHGAQASVYKDQLAAETCRPGADQAAVNSLPRTLKDDPAYDVVYKSIKESITKKGERSTTVDPQRNTIQDTYTQDDFVALCEAWLLMGTPEADRSLAMGAWAHSSVGRSDDVRLFYLADIIAPQHIPAVGKCEAHP